MQGWLYSRPSVLSLMNFSVWAIAIACKNEWKALRGKLWDNCFEKWMIGSFERDNSSELLFTVLMFYGMNVKLLFVKLKSSN